MTKKRLNQINLIPRNRLRYAVVGLFLASILFATCATVFIGVYSYISTYLGKSEDTLILTQSGTGNFIATRYISMQIAESAEYIQGITLVSPETLTPCMINEKTSFVRGIICDKFYSIEKFTLRSGRFLSDDDIYGAFLGNRAAKRFQISVGDLFIIYSGLRDINLQVRAIGIYSSEDVALNDEILVPLFTGQILSGNYPDQITYIRVKYNETLISRNSIENFLISKHYLTVKLLSNETEIPIEGGNVNIYDINGNFLKTGTTDSLGESSFILDFGNYTINSIYGQTQINYSIFLDIDTEISLRIATPPGLYSLNVKVLNENYKGIPYKTVVAWKGSEIVQMRQTNINGETNFSLPSDIYQFSTLFWNNFTQESVEFRQTANPSQNESLIFWYHRFKLGVRTSDPISGTFLNTTVVIKIMNGTIIGTEETGNLGYTEFGELIPTTYNVSVIYGEIKDYQIIKLRSDRTVNFEILPQFNLEVHVYNDSNDLPINNSYIRLFDSLSNHFESYTNEDGISTLLLKFEIYNITVQSGTFIKSRIVQLNSSKIEIFFMPYYNLTIVLNNLSGFLQNNINISLISSSLNDSKLSQDGLATFFVPPDTYNITLNCSNIFISQTYDIFDTLDPISFITPPYNLTIYIQNGTNIKMPPLSGINVSIFDNTTSKYVTSSISVAGTTNFLLNPGLYNVSVNISNVFYYKYIDFNQPFVDLIFYSYPFNLTITIFNGTTFTPQPNLQVQLYNLYQNLIAGPNNTDSGGRVTFFINPMTYNITINSSDYLIFKERNIVNPNTIYNFEFPPYNLTILVFNASNNLPIQNALLEILAFEDNSTLFSETTTSGGVAQFNLNPGDYYINLTYETYNLVQFREIIADPQINYHIPPYKLKVQVVDYWEAPLEDANVSINGGELLKTNESGYIDFYLQPDIYNITASWGEFTDFQIIDMSTYQDAFLIVIKLMRKVFLNISVVNAISGRFLINASVSIFEFLGEFIDSKFTDQNGFCQFYISPQVYNLSVLYKESHEYQLINLTSDLSVIFSFIPLYPLIVFTFDDSDIYYTENVLVQIFELGGQQLFQDFTNNYGLCLFKLEYGTYNISLQKGLDQKWKIIDISQTEFLSFHMAPYMIKVNVINATTVTPISNALITVYTLDGVEVISNRTNELGLSEFLINPGQYLIYLNISVNFWVKELDLQQSNSSMHIIFMVSTDATSKIDVGDPAEYTASLLQQTLGLTESIVYILTIILTILVSFSIMNVVSSCVSESRKQIGIIKSIGASNRQIYYIINFRIILISIIAGLLGGLLGIMIGSFISIKALEISLFQILTFQLFSSIILLSIAMTLLIGMISSNLTLYRILKIPIATSIKEILPKTL